MTTSLSDVFAYPRRAGFYYYGNRMIGRNDRFMEIWWESQAECSVRLRSSGRVVYRSNYSECCGFVDRLADLRARHAFYRMEKTERAAAAEKRICPDCGGCGRLLAIEDTTFDGQDELPMTVYERVGFAPVGTAVREIDCVGCKGTGQIAA